MANITAFGSVSSIGKLSLSNEKRFKQDVLQFKGCTVELTVKKRNTRSTPQNNYMWGVLYAEIVIRLRFLGNTDKDDKWVHEFCKLNFNPIEVIGPGGEVIGKGSGSTTDMNKEEMSAYWDRIILWCNEFLEITVPLPNEKLQFNF